jgi:hypothetical protein
MGYNYIKLKYKDGSNIIGVRTHSHSREFKVIYSTGNSFYVDNKFYFNPRTYEKYINKMKHGDLVIEFLTKEQAKVEIL